MRLRIVVLALIAALFLSPLAYGMEMRASMKVQSYDGTTLNVLSTDGELFVFIIAGEHFKKGDPVTAVFQVVYKGGEGKQEKFEITGGFVEWE
jgi:hypothetical protein